jgi:hypothetical protein
MERITNKDWAMEWSYAPSQFCQDGKEVTFESEYKRTPTSGAFTGKLENKCGGYPLGPMKGWSQLQFDFAGNGTNLDSTEMTFSQTLNHSDFWLGCNFVTPIPKPALSTAAASLLWKNGAWDFWARGSFMRKVFGSGLTYR